MVAEEINRAEVIIKPKPAEYNMDRVARDPRRGQYKDPYGPPYNRLCKEVGQYKDHYVPPYNRLCKEVRQYKAGLPSESLVFCKNESE